MRKFKVVAQGEYNENDVELSKDEIIKILGNNRNIVNLYKKGFFTTAIDRNIAGSHYSLGIEISYNTDFLDIWHYIRSVLSDTYTKTTDSGILSMYICEELDGSISLGAECLEGSCEFKAHLDEKGSIEYFEIGDEKTYDNNDIIISIEDAIKYCQSLFKVPIHSIEYIPRIVISDDLVGYYGNKYYIGLCSCKNYHSKYLKKYRDLGRNIDDEYTVIIFESL